MKSIITGVALATLLVGSSAFAADDMSKNKQPGASTNSGAGVKGAEDSTNGPSSKSPGGANTGASSGEAGSKDGSAPPSPDASGVKGAQDSTNGPSDKSPGSSTSK
jgi:hypothetical protein